MNIYILLEVLSDDRNTFITILLQRVGAPLNCLLSDFPIFIEVVYYSKKTYYSLITIATNRFKNRKILSHSLKMK